ncbi:MAG: NUDIX domain-containing protein [Planctomycetes bacterium]|nr:NUDIX domain-containing protein [Planctomycetota bacterium]
MLQQTQAGRVAQMYPAFLRRFPTPKRLARSTEQAVLSQWQGLGYYRRARNLQAAAKEMTLRFGGRVPRLLEDLRSLPGVGRYTAGAVASLAYGQAAPIVDGNVARVLSRLADRRESVKGSAAQTWLWSAAERLVRAAKSPAVLNEALMELGATICTPRSPRCGACPLKSLCASRRANSQEFVPLTSPDKPRRTVVHHACVEIRGSKLGVETRPATGLWAGLLSPPVVEAPGNASPARLLQMRRDIKRIRGFDREFEFLTSHRRIRFRVHHVEFRPGAKLRWIPLAKLEDYAVSNAVLQIARPPLEAKPRPGNR